MSGNTTDSVEYFRHLSQSGMDDVLVLDVDTVDDVLNKQRMALLNAIDDNGETITSVTDLARYVDRDISHVSDDLDELFEADIIDFEHDGRKKRAVLAHKYVVTKPIVSDGRVQ